MWNRFHNLSDLDRAEQPVRPIAALSHALLLAVALAAPPFTETPAAQGGPVPVPVPAGQGRGGGGGDNRPSQRPPQTVTPQSYPPEQVRAGASVFSAQCGFCHGRDAAGGETGPDLTRSLLVAVDVRGDKIGPVVREGRVDKQMPAFNLPAPDLAAIVAFVHDQKTKAESQEGTRRSVDVADLQSGNAEAGKQFFEGAGACTKCHAANGDLAGVASRLQGLPLLQRMLNPGSGRGAGSARAASTVTVTLPSGQTVTGRLAYRDEFTIALTDGAGWYRSWSIGSIGSIASPGSTAPTGQVKFTVTNPLDAHIEQLGKYTDEDMHNVLAFLQTLR